MQPKQIRTRSRRSNSKRKKRSQRRSRRSNSKRKKRTLVRQKERGANDSWVLPVAATGLAVGLGTAYYLHTRKGTKEVGAPADIKGGDHRGTKRKTGNPSYGPPTKIIPRGDLFTGVETTELGHFRPGWFEYATEYPYPKYVDKSLGLIVDFKCRTGQMCGLIASEDGKVGIMIAGNSGLALGALAYQYPKPDLKKQYRTQEEDVLQDWLVASMNMKKSVQATMDLVYCKWGMVHPKDCVWGSGPPPDDVRFRTMQGIDYHNLPREAANAFRESWFLEDQYMGIKGRNIYKTTLVWVAGPQANPDMGTPDGTMHRTFVKSVSGHGAYKYFLKMVRAALEAAFDTMIKLEVDIPIVAAISTGVYAGVHGNQYTEINGRKKLQTPGRINQHFIELVRNVLAGKPKGSNYPRKDYFKYAVLPRNPMDENAKYIYPDMQAYV